jgi:hypothetical protein
VGGPAAAGFVPVTVAAPSLANESPQFVDLERKQLANTC